MKNNLLILVVISMSAFSGFAQKASVEEVTFSLLDSMNLEYYAPVENQVKFLKPRPNEYFPHDVRMKIKANEMEVLIAFHEDTTTSPIATFYPHLEFNRLLNNLVPNDDDQEVLVIGWREPRLREKNADWGAEAYIRPRQEITSFPFAKLISFYSEDEGLVVMLYCFRKPDNVPDLLAFKADTDG